MMKLNQTPVRTARNFNINNIKIEDFEMSKTVPEFNGTKLTGIEARSRFYFV